MRDPDVFMLWRPRNFSSPLGLNLYRVGDKYLHFWPIGPYVFLQVLPPFSLIRDFGKQNTRRNISKITVSLVCY